MASTDNKRVSRKKPRKGLKDTSQSNPASSEDFIKKSGRNNNHVQTEDDVQLNDDYKYRDSSSLLAQPSSPIIVDQPVDDHSFHQHSNQQIHTGEHQQNRDERVSVGALLIKVNFNSNQCCF